MKYLITAFAALMVSCASTHPGREGHSINQSKIPLKISAKTVEEPEGESFQLVEITLENMSDEWLKINNAKVLIKNPAESKISVVVGKDLVDWAKAMELRAQKDEHNKKMFQVGLAAVGVVASTAGAYKNNSTLSGAGTAALIGTYAWAATDVIGHAYRKAEGVKTHPDNHLYESMSIPGKMFLRKWVLINKPSNTVLTKLVVQIETVDGERGVYELAP